MSSAVVSMLLESLDCSLIASTLDRPIFASRCSRSLLRALFCERESISLCVQCGELRD